MNNKYEQLVEFIINDETDKARELFHEIVVEKSRDIYENLVAEEDLDEVGGNEVEDLVDEVSLDEEGISEEEEEGEEGAEEVGAFDAEEEFGSEEGAEDDVEARVDDLESALDELKAEFDALMAGEDHGDEGMHGDEGAEESPEEFYEAEESEEELDEAKEEDEEAEEVDETIVREYVEKVATPANTEGAAVGTGKSVAINKKSTVAGKNDMGGTAKNLVQGGSEANPDGTTPNKSVSPKGDLVSNPQNKPGANAGKTAFKTKETQQGGQEGKLAGNNGSVAINKTSPLAK